MKSFITSYHDLFGRSADGVPAVRRIEIPLIQRDYAQGREGKATERIRTAFLEALHEAVTTDGRPLNLDFVYGEVEGGTLRPMDGQQRLTTLFLLHWFLAWRCGRLAEDGAWKNFTYATRPSARRFCERLVDSRPAADLKGLADWIQDRPWFLHSWEHDPTIASMLVMLDAIEALFAGDDCEQAWARLTDSERPAVAFHLLPIKREEMGLSDELYIRMNARGKALSAFENFKAEFQQLLEQNHPQRLEDFAQKADGDWTDLLWPYRGEDQVIDDEFLGYFRFLTDVCLWREGQLSAGELSDVAKRVFAESGRAAEHVAFLVQAFDTWIGVDIGSYFGRLFAKEASSIDYTSPSPQVVLFTGAPDLFEQCCHRRPFTLGQQLLLYAVLLHRLHGSEDFSRRLRTLRNLIETSDVRDERMPVLVRDAFALIVAGQLEGLPAFNQAQLEEERLKRSFTAAMPAAEPLLFELEDHPLLRGVLGAFELDAATFNARAQAFLRLFAGDALFEPLSGALLATGNYARWDGKRAQLASVHWSAWRNVLGGASRSGLGRIRETLGRLLDVVAADGREAALVLATLQTDYLNGGALDWRWYFVRYAAMREGHSGFYVDAGAGSLGYCVCMLDKYAMSSKHRDAFLCAMRRESGREAAVEDARFIGYEWQPRWMELRKSRVRVRCTDGGIALQAPANPVYAAAFAGVCASHGVSDELLLRLPQVERDGRLLDTVDRVQLGAALLRDLVDAGL